MSENRKMERIACMMGISETELRILLNVLKKGETTADNLAKELNVSFPLANKYLYKLYQQGLINRIKDPNSKSGRPKYIYVLKADDIKQKMIDIIKKTTDEMIETIMNN